MCRYAGGKKRIANELYEVMRDIEIELMGEKTKLPYFEPFVGMCNVAKEFNDGRPRTLCDANSDVIKMWQAVLHKNWKPPKASITEKYYNDLKKNTKPSAERGFYGTTCAFNGAFMTGYIGKAGDDVRKAIKSGHTNILKYKPLLTDVNVLDAASYNVFEPKGMLIYCDPPYARTIGRGFGKYLQMFNIDEFWDVMRKWSKHNLVFISEEKAPRDFIAVWKIKLNRSGHGKSVKNYDKLFMHKNIYNDI